MSLDLNRRNYNEKGLAIVRIVTGLFLILHGAEVFDSDKMQQYAQMEYFKDMNGLIWSYLGKCLELLSGIFLMIGMYTRVASAIVVITFLYITFFIGSGQFWYQDQHPFLFVLLGLVFFFYGSGVWGIDKWKRTGQY